MLYKNRMGPKGVLYWPKQYLFGNFPKSTPAYLSIDKALMKLHGWNLPVPLHLRNAPTALMKELDYGKDYKYPQ